MGKRYVHVPPDVLKATLSNIGDAIRTKGGDYTWTRQGREQVFEVMLPINTAIRVYTTMNTAGETRGCGEDAIRVVVGVFNAGRFTPMRKSVKVLRTAPKADTEAERLDLFVDRLTGVVRDAYAAARELRATCPRCKSILRKRKGRHGSFMGCSAFPECRYTEPCKS